MSIKKIVFLSFAVLQSMIAAAQGNVTGKVIDGITKEGIIQGTVALLKSDSSYINGTTTAVDGSFTLKVSKAGKYIIKVSYIGYEPYTKTVTMANSNIPLGTITLKQNSIMLKGAEVTGQAKKVIVKEDTFVYNASAYRTPEGSVVEELVKRIPGAEVDDNGNVKINGKEVKKIYVQGKEFMTGDTKTALKNIPTSVVDQIRAYDEKSDLSRITGIDDGEESTVLDIGMKMGMNKGYFGNIDLAVGTQDRYAERLMGAIFKDDLRIMGMGGMNNTNDMGFGGRGGYFGGGRNGDNSSKDAAVNVNYEKKDKLVLNGSVRYRHNDGDARTINSSESFVGATTSSFSNSNNKNFTRGNSWNGQARLEWTPDTMTNILFRPSFTYSDNDGRQLNASGTYNQDPFKYVSDPLDSLMKKTLIDQGIIVNDNISRSISYSDNKSINGELQFNRKIGNKGRNFTIRLEGSSGSNDSKNFSASNVNLYQLLTDSTYSTNRWNLTPTDNWSYSIGFTYSEPIFKATFLQFTYNYTKRYQKSERSTYDYSQLGDFTLLNPRYRGWDEYFDAYLHGQSPTDEQYLNKDLSRFTEYTNNIHTFRIMTRIIRQNYNLNFGFSFTPQNSHYKQDYLGQKVDTVRNVFNWSPQVNFRYRFSKVSQLRIQYRGNSSEPSMSQLLEIRDDSDPLNISTGNSGLKPSFSQNFNLYYNNYFTSHSRAVMANLGFTTTSNSISNMVTYNPETGGRITRPENINGNWNANGGFMFNTSIDSVGIWNVNTFTNLSYNNSVGYVSLNMMDGSQKNTTRTTNVSERLAGSYRNDWLELELNGTLNYTHSNNLLQKQNNLDTWQFSYGGTLNVTLPWGMQLNTSMNMNSRRGYNDASMNTNELIWNAQIAQGFLTGKPLTVMLQVYDILHEQSSVSRTINAMMRQDSQYNSVNSYAMLHVVYRFNIFGDKQARREMKQARRMGMDGMMPMGGMPMGGMPMGGMPMGGGFGGGGFGGGGFGGPR